MMGRENAEGTQCLYCDLKHSQKEEAQCWFHKTKPGVMYTRDTLKNPVWDFLRPECVVIPTLHILLGLVDYVYQRFWEWIDDDVERIPAEEKEARVQVIDAELLVDQLEAELEECRDERNGLVAARVAANKFKQRCSKKKSDEYNEAIKRAKDIQDAVTVVRSEIENLENDLKHAKDDLRLAREVALAIRKQRQKDSSQYSVRDEINFDILYPKRIRGSVYHGGKMEGPACRLFAGRAKECFLEIRTKIMTKKESLQVDEQKVRHECKRFETILLLLDGMFSILYQASGTVNEAEISRLENTIAELGKQWTKAEWSWTPKFHIIAAHTVPYLRNYGGWGDIGEDWIERSHQRGARYMHLMARMRSDVAKFDACATWESRDNRNDIKETRQLVTEGRRKRRKCGSKLTYPETNKKARIEKEQQVKKEVREGAITSSQLDTTVEKDK
jgi:hypothetical protein